MTPLKSGNMKLRAVFNHTILPLAVAALTVTAPVSAAPTRPIRFDRLSLEQGLSQSAGGDGLQVGGAVSWSESRSCIGKVSMT